MRAQSPLIKFFRVWKKGEQVDARAAATNMINTAAFIDPRAVLWNSARVASEKTIKPRQRRAEALYRHYIRPLREILLNDVKIARTA